MCCEASLGGKAVARHTRHHDRCVLSTYVEVYGERRNWSGFCVSCMRREKRGDEKEKRSGSVTRLREDGLCLLCKSHVVPAKAFLTGRHRGKRERERERENRRAMSGGELPDRTIMRGFVRFLYFNFCLLVLLIFLSFLVSFLFCKISYLVDHSVLHLFICLSSS